jgi:hypothetical protein
MMLGAMMALALTATTPTASTTNSAGDITNQDLQKDAKAAAQRAKTNKGRDAAMTHALSQDMANQKAVEQAAADARKKDAKNEEEKAEATNADERADQKADADDKGDRMADDANAKMDRTSDKVRSKVAGAKSDMKDMKADRDASASATPCIVKSSTCEEGCHGLAGKEELSCKVACKKDALACKNPPGTIKSDLKGDSDRNTLHARRIHKRTKRTTAPADTRTDTTTSTPSTSTTP